MTPVGVSFNYLFHQFHVQRLYMYVSLIPSPPHLSFCLAFSPQLQDKSWGGEDWERGYMYVCSGNAWAPLSSSACAVSITPVRTLIYTIRMVLHTSTSLKIMVIMGQHKLEYKWQSLCALLITVVIIVVSHDTDDCTCVGKFRAAYAFQNA